MHLEPKYAIDEGDLQSISYNIYSHRLSEEEVGFNLREQSEPIPRVESNQIGSADLPFCSDCGAPTLTIVFAGLHTCPPYTDISLNGRFTLTRFESCGWVGTGGKFDQGFGPQDAFILVVCPEHVIYSADTGFADQFFLGLGPPGSRSFNNFYVTCLDGGDGFGGTARLSP